MLPESEYHTLTDAYLIYRSKADPDQILPSRTSLINHMKTLSLNNKRVEQPIEPDENARIVDFDILLTSHKEPDYDLVSRNDFIRIRNEENDK